MEAAGGGVAQGARRGRGSSDRGRQRRRPGAAVAVAGAGGAVGFGAEEEEGQGPNRGVRREDWGWVRGNMDIFDPGSHLSELLHH